MSRTPSSPHDPPQDLDPGAESDPGPDFGFGRPFDRAGTGSSKWARAVGPGVIAMGLADMDLPGPPAVAEALERRARHRAYGYTACDPAGRELVARWYRSRHGVEIDPDWVLLLPFGPRTAVRLLLEAVRPTAPIVFPTPEWGGFAQICRAAGLPYRELPLAVAAEDGYHLPPGPLPRPVGAVLLSNPHNPSGRVWPAAEISELAEKAGEAGALLVSDEVHGDLTHPGHAHPVAVVAAGPSNRHVVTLNSVGKTFNASGLPSGFALVPDPALRARLTGIMAGFGFWEGGLVEQTVQQAALREGGPWLDALLAHLAAARTLLTDRLGSAVRSVPQASYLLWLDAAALGLPPATARRALLDRCGLEASDGTEFGPGGHGALRLNYALPQPVLETVLERLPRL
ncbi:aminotransferase class I/II-fold pyridoxal phosphate-dependent enzyme [Streptomyces kaniharaensis]|uniref:cysteine-S-conjugate beta-lyase n=1 Tax=Streptomyces kaniharaensis TaxID=212423 RepID=A0A6N7KY72_9ACTN|nr:aminotransferase class I/II-fold pyridoxal phosphate-dependent enzyme [Streptomyces kaniharaensis]MQS15198.1 aminotransferase class I/II-fold pyridoxal phosphate-dependent enzyme [Streptomyces kaniharaensis]